MQPSPTDLLPHLLYRVEDEQARFATWRMAEGHEALAIFTTAETAAAYRDELSGSSGWITHQPPRQQFVDILAACRNNGVAFLQGCTVDNVIERIDEGVRVIAGHSEVTAIKGRAHQKRKLPV